MHVLLRPAQDRAAEAARDAVADDEVVDREERPAVSSGFGHAATSTELAKWHALTCPSPTGSSSGRSAAQRAAAR